MTFSSHEEAERISLHIVKAKLAACANIIPEIHSIYEWEGKMHNDKETLVFFKTTVEKFKALEAEIVKLHSYDVPCVLSLDIKEGHAPYLNWIKCKI